MKKLTSSCDFVCEHCQSEITFSVVLISEDDEVTLQGTCACPGVNTIPLDHYNIALELRNKAEKEHRATRRLLQRKPSSMKGGRCCKGAGITGKQIFIMPEPSSEQ